MGLLNVLSNFAKWSRIQNQPEVLRTVSKSYSLAPSIPVLKTKEVNNLITLNTQKSAIYTPNFGLYNSILRSFPEVESIQNKLIDRIIGIGGKFVDENNDEQKIEMDYSHIWRDFIQNILTYGQVITAEVEVKEESKNIIIPSHQITYWQAKGLEINHFRWQFEGQSIVFNTEKDKFNLFRNSNTDSMFFGKSKLQSLYDVLNTLHLDREAFNLFLEHNSFPGLSIFAKEGITAQDRAILEDTLVDLNSKEGRYKANLLENVEKIEQIKQEIQSKLSSTEYENILKLVCFSYSYPYGLLNGGGGLGQGEQKSQLIQLRDEAIVPLQKQLAEFINYLLKRNPELENIKWIPNEMEVETKSAIIESGIKLYQSGIINGKTLKKKYLGYDDRELTPDDEYRVIAQNVNLIKEGGIEQFLAQNKPTPETTPQPKAKINSKSNPKKPILKFIMKK